MKKKTLPTYDHTCIIGHKSVSFDNDNMHLYKNKNKKLVSIITFSNYYRLVVYISLRSST